MISLPSLVWPGAGISSLFADVSLPGLSAFLGYGKTGTMDGQTLFPWLARLFSLADPAWGVLRRRGEALPIPQEAQKFSYVLCADPISLAFTRDALLVRGPESLALQQFEAQLLAEALNLEFPDVGYFEAVTPKRWYVHTHTLPARFYPLNDVVGRPATLFGPDGEQARTWNRIANEIQVFLFNHPFNQDRSRQAKLAANAVWFWGHGSLDGAPGDAFSNVLSDDPQVRGLADWAGIPLITHGDSVFDNLPLGKTLYYDGTLHEAALSGELETWFARVQSIDAQIFLPVWFALQRGALHHVKLLAPGDKNGLVCELGHRSRWRFWRNPLSTEKLTPLLQTRS